MIISRNLKKITALLLLIIAGTYITILLTSDNSFITGYKEPKSVAPVFSSSPLAVVGDLQRTSVYELLIGREQNDVERGKIIKSIADQNPAALVILGDLIFDGSDKNDWRYYDSLMEPIHEKSIPIFPVIGNHEYWGNNKVAMQNLNERFPFFLTHHWYTEIYDSLALIFLDSNESEMGEDGWELERNWLNTTVDIFDTSSAVKGIIIFDHHPPFTNSLVTGDEINVQSNFLPAYLHSNKTLLFISGHAHTYERFFIKGKMFVVSGGGGGPRVDLKIGEDEHKDLYDYNSPRPFNYLLITRERDGIKIKVKGLKKGESNFFDMEEFKLKFFDKGN